MNRKFLDKRDMRTINEDVRSFIDSLKRPNGVIVYKINRYETEDMISGNVHLDPFFKGPTDVTKKTHRIEKIPVHLDAIIAYDSTDIYTVQEPGVVDTGAACFLIVKVSDSGAFKIQDVIEVEGERYTVVRKIRRGFIYPNRVIFDCRKVGHNIISGGDKV